MYADCISEPAIPVRALADARMCRQSLPSLSHSMIPAFRAFRSLPFRFYFTDQFLSLIGAWMQSIATTWLVYRLTGSPLLLGITTGVQQLPMLFLVPFAGPAPTVPERSGLTSS